MHHLIWPCQVINHKTADSVRNDNSSRIIFIVVGPQLSFQPSGLANNADTGPLVAANTERHLHCTWRKAQRESTHLRKYKLHFQTFNDLKAWVWRFSGCVNLLGKVHLNLSKVHHNQLSYNQHDLKFQLKTQPNSKKLLITHKEL